MEIIHSIDSEGNLRWTPVPDGYTLDRVKAILRLMGHTVSDVKARKAQ